jgi:hypothetical protein
VTIETDELVAWPPVRIQVDPDGSGWVDVAGTRTALSCEDLAAARAAAVAQVVRTAGLLGRPVTATATGPEGQAVVVVQPDGTVRDATPVRRRRWLGRRLAPTAGLSWEGTSREVPPTGPATCPPASPPVLEEPEPIVVVDDRGPVDVAGPSLVSIAPPMLEEEAPPEPTPVDAVDEAEPEARRPRRGRRILAGVLAATLIAAATAGALVWTAGERQAAGARDASARQAATAQLATERAALATALDQAASLLEDAAGQVGDSPTKDTLAAAAAAGRSEAEQAAGAGDAATLTASATKVHDAAAAISSAASAFEAARDALWTSWADLAASLSSSADDGQHLVDATAGKVLDDSTRQALSKDVEGARTLLTAASGRQLGPAAAASQASMLRAAIATDSTSVNDSHTAWQSDQASQAAAAAAAAASGSTSTKPPAKSGGTTSTSKPPSSTTSSTPADPPPASTGGRVTHLSASASSGVGTAAFTVSVSTNGPTSVSVSVRLGSTSIPMSGPGSVDGTGTFTGSVSGLAAGTYSWIVSAGGMTTSGSLEVS